MLLQNQVERGAVLENLDLDLLCLGETLDEGCATQFLHPDYEVRSYTVAPWRHVAQSFGPASPTITTDLLSSLSDLTDILLARPLYHGGRKNDSTDTTPNAFPNFNLWRDYGKTNQVVLNACFSSAFFFFFWFCVYCAEAVKSMVRIMNC